MCTAKKCIRSGPITSNGYLNFLREYRQRTSGMSPTETVRAGAREWNKLSFDEKAEYKLMADDLDNDCVSDTMLNMSPSDSCCQKKPQAVAKPAPKAVKCVKPKKKNPCKKRRRRRRTRCKPKVKAKAKSRCRKRRRRRAIAKAKPKTRCRSKRRRRRRKCGGTRKSKSKCMRAGPVTNNGYLNFLRWFRKCNCGMTPKQAIRRGARKWCSLPQSEKDKFNKMACKVSRSKRRRNSCFCRGGSRG